MTAIEAETECVQRRENAERRRLLLDAARRLREEIDSIEHGCVSPYRVIDTEMDDVRLLVEFVESHIRKEAK